MERLERNDYREERIRDEATVDAHGPEETAMSWWYYIGENIAFPFKARCIREVKISPLIFDEVVEVVDMAPLDDCRTDMLVLVQWQNRTLGVPLSQVDPLDVDEDAEEIIADWHYWVGRGYQII